MATFTQANRLLAVNSPLGEDALLLTGFRGREALSQLFSYHLELLAERDDIAANELVGKNLSWTVARTDEEPRYFNGYVNRFSAGGKGLYGLRVYRVEVVPWLWFLTRTATCRNFPPDTKAPEIIAAVFKPFGFAEVDDSKLAGGKFAPREYCVQYRETAFNFVSRLMEEEGIFYFWKHENGKHTLMLCRQKSDYPECPEKEVYFSSGSLAEEKHISSWQHDFEFRSGRVTHTDYNFETPKTLPARDLITSVQSVIDQPEAAGFELFDYPGAYKIKGDGNNLITVRMEEEEAAYDVARGSGNCSTFFPGGTFTLAEHEVEAESAKPYVLTSVEHLGRDTTYGNQGESSYANSFTCIPATVSFRPPRVTPKPVVHGVQTAVVVGPPGEEIHTDKYARVKVQFHWDREHTFDDKSSFWIRVATPWAGKGYGMLHIPRIGQEVVVDFLEGDPDRPLIVGSVYNADQMPPGNLPQDKMVQGLRSSTYPGGKGHNGLIMDDSKGKQMITLHGERDMSTTIEHDDTQHIKNNRTITVDGTHTETIAGDTSITVTKGKYSHDVKTGTATIHVKGDVLETFDAKQTTNVSSTIAISSLKANIYAQAATTIKLEVGKSFLAMDKDGNIILSGVKIDILAKDQINAVSDATAKISAPAVLVSGGKEAKLGVSSQNVVCDTAKVALSGAAINSSAVGMHEITGALVKIN